MNDIFLIFALWHVLVFQTITCTNIESGTSPTQSNNSVHVRSSRNADQNRHNAVQVAERSTEYQKRKQIKVAKLENLGVKTDVAKEVVTKFFSSYHENWVKVNKERGKELKKKSYRKRYEFVKDKTNERRREIYHQRKAAEPLVRGRTQTVQQRHEANVRTHMKNGKTREEAIVEADKYMDGFRNKTCLRLQRLWQAKNQKAAAQDGPTALNEDKP